MFPRPPPLKVHRPVTDWAVAVARSGDGRGSAPAFPSAASTANPAFRCRHALPFNLQSRKRRRGFLQRRRVARLCRTALHGLQRAFVQLPRVRALLLAVKMLDEFPVSGDRHCAHLHVELDRAAAKSACCSLPLWSTRTRRSALRERPVIPSKRPQSFLVPPDRSLAVSDHAR